MGFIRGDRCDKNDSASDSDVFDAPTIVLSAIRSIVFTTYNSYTHIARSRSAKRRRRRKRAHYIARYLRFYKSQKDVGSLIDFKDLDRQLINTRVGSKYTRSIPNLIYMGDSPGEAGVVDTADKPGVYRKLKELRSGVLRMSCTRSDAGFDMNEIMTLNHSLLPGLHYVGRSYIRSKSGPPRPHHRDVEFLNFFKNSIHCNPELLFHCTARERIPGHHSYNEMHFKNFSQSSPVHKLLDNMLLFVAKNYGVKLLLRKLRCIEHDACLRHGINRKSSPGFGSSCRNKTEHVNKGGGWAAAVVNRVMAYERIPNLSVYLCGGREKMTSMLKRRCKSRLILMAPTVDNLITQTISVPITAQFDHDAYLGECFIGQSFCKGRYKNMTRWRDGSSYVFAGDFKSFDSFVPRKVLEYACAMLACVHQDNTYVNNVIHYGTQSLIHTNIVKHDGRVLRKSRGIASGHSWTSLVGSLANWLMLRSMLCCVFGKRVANKCNVAVCGDDFVVGMPRGWFSKKIFNIESICNGWLYYLFGCSIKEGSMELEYPFVIYDTVRHRVPFLCHYMVNGFPERRIEEVLDSLANPPKNVKSWHRRLHTATSFLYDTPFSKEVTPMIKDWIRYIYKHLGYKPMNVEEYIRFHENRGHELNVCETSNLCDWFVVPENERIWTIGKKKVTWRRSEILKQKHDLRSLYFYLPFGRPSKIFRSSLSYERRIYKKSCLSNRIIYYGVMGYKPTHRLSVDRALKIILDNFDVTTGYSKPEIRTLNCIGYDVNDEVYADTVSIEGYLSRDDRHVRLSRSGGQEMPTHLDRILRQ